MTTDQILDEAIAYAAEAWPRFEARLPANLHFRDKVTFFAQQVRPAMVARFPAMIAATDQVILLALAKGIEKSGCVARHRIERDLGILLPH